ncbi:hypothetical protein [Streptococcus ruminantium]|nr:hypothetical protein [Streptococcus ruminantium]
MSKLVAEVTNEENEVADSRSPNLGGTAEIERNSSLSSVSWMGIFVSSG